MPHAFDRNTVLPLPDRRCVLLSNTSQVDQSAEELTAFCEETEMARTIISWQTLFQHDVFGRFGKLASIWFEDIIFQVPSHDALQKVFDKLVADGSLSVSAASMLGDIWTPVQLVMPGYKFLDKLTDGNWLQKNEHLLRISYESALSAMLKEFPTANPEDAAFQHEVRWFSY